MNTTLEPSRFRRTFAALALVLAAIAAPGCVKKPTMALDHADVAGVTVSLPPSVGLLLRIHVDVYNPNSYDVAVRAVRGTVVLAGRYTVPVEYAAEGEGLWLGSDATTRVVVPVELPLTTSLAILAESTTAATIPYHFTGSADVTASRTFKIEKDDYSVSEDGLLSRAQLQAGLHIGG